MARPKIEVTDMDKLEAWAKEQNHDGLVSIVTEKREDKKKLRNLVKHALGLKQTIPGVTVSFPVKDKNQTELEDAIAKTGKAEVKPDPSANTRFPAPEKKPVPPVANRTVKRA